MIKKTIFGILFLAILVGPAFGRECDSKCKYEMKKDSCKTQKVDGCMQDKSCDGHNHPGMHPNCMGFHQKSNPLDANAKEFIVNDVQRIAILPFSDYSSVSPVESHSAKYWASRRIHDFMTAEFLEMGKLVVPYDTMVAALAEIRGQNVNQVSGISLLEKQLSGISLSAVMQETALRSVTETMKTSEVYSLDLTSDEIVALGAALNVDAIFMGSISDYGTSRYVKADARTFIPPFLGLWNPTKKSQIRMLVYMFESENGELIWSSMEEVSHEPTFPLFANNNMSYEKLNKKLADSIVNHFRNVFEGNMGFYKKPQPLGGPGDVRREKDIRILIKK
ncbi:hypothetical protein KKB99_01635 [bacterium]|nr:hypothetical protein [bacterium]MBU1024688.1 hypothetical protein [bacterium]